ncbi:MAG: hypothetical protein M3O02_11235 [Acidobacteriota bacterium]|nr:hypothetical protein [Acidobacteriota bacterium]
MTSSDISFVSRVEACVAGIQTGSITPHDAGCLDLGPSTSVGVSFLVDEQVFRWTFRREGQKLVYYVPLSALQTTTQAK